MSVVSADVENFKKLNDDWSSKVEFLDDVFEVNKTFRIVSDPVLEEEFTKYAAENGFETTVLNENLQA